MFQLNHDTNRIEKIPQSTFSQLGKSERFHLQEWIANYPSCLGEDLLIIQKEFDGFNDTHERLDLLALDKNGDLVIIENKLDDSGRDVTWQAIKYASYCSTLTRDDIAEIYQDYLLKQGLTEKAKERISDFLEKEFEETEINRGTSQRIILIAADFRKEVTSAVMWLRNQNLRIQCIKVTPYELGEKCIVDFEQIIPTKDTEEYIISLARKSQHEKDSNATTPYRFSLRHKFWEEMLSRLRDKTPIFQNTTASENYYLSSRANVSGLRYNMVVTKNYVAVELEINRVNQDENKQLFELLYNQRSKIESAFGYSLEWDRMDHLHKSRVRYKEPDLSIYMKEDWPELMTFLETNMVKLEESFRPYLNLLKTGTSKFD